MWRDGIDTEVSAHIFTVSAAMVGVCLTVVGIIRLGITLSPGYSTLADDLLAADAFAFMAACLLSYSSLRTPSPSRTKRLERYADVLFVIGLSTMCLVCAVIAFSFL